MWGNEDKFQGGGGFDANATFSTPGNAQTDKKGAKRAQSIVPVNVRQVLESPEDGLKIGGIDVQLMTLIGIVKAVEVSSVKITYTVEDDTGIITGMFWLDGEQDGNQPEKVPVVENTYCRMTGSVRTHSGKKNILVFSIQPVTDLNEITAHILSVIHISLKSEETANQPDVPFIKFEMEGGVSGIDNLGLNPQQQRVYRAIQQCPSESGVNSKEILNAMTIKMPIKEIEKELEFLIGEGHIYTTIDDTHFRATSFQ